MKWSSSEQRGYQKARKAQLSTQTYEYFVFSTIIKLCSMTKNERCPHTDTMHLNSVASWMDPVCECVYACVSVCWVHGPSVTVLMLIAVALRADWARPPALTQMAHLQMQQALMCRAAKWALRYSTSCLRSQLSVNPSLSQFPFPHSPLSNSLFLPLSPHFLSFAGFHHGWFSTCLSVTMFHSHCFPISFFSSVFLCIIQIYFLFIYYMLQIPRLKNCAYLTTWWFQSLSRE